jgi:transcriptional regulator with XRE-family HTH domain
LSRESFKDRFNILFEESKMTQEEFGKMFNASKSQVYHWRTGSGEPDTKTLALIASKCGVSGDWLIGISNVRSPIKTIAAHRTDDPTTKLPEEARKSLEDFKKFIFEKHGIKYD